MTPCSKARGHFADAFDLVMCCKVEGRADIHHAPATATSSGASPAALPMPAWASSPRSLRRADDARKPSGKGCRRRHHRRLGDMVEELAADKSL
jgi:hypothetical protein